MHISQNLFKFYMNINALLYFPKYDQNALKEELFNIETLFS